MKWLLSLSVALLVSSIAVAQMPPSYARQVQPFLTRYCVECHNTREPEGGLDLASHKALLEGGKRGVALKPGKPDESLLVRLVEHKQKPIMPPARSRQPSPAEVALVRAWVLAGASDDSTAIKVTLPRLASRVKVSTPVAALAFSPDGKRLAAAGRGEILLLDVASGEPVAHLPAGKDRVTAIAFAPAGNLLAAASSTAGEGHEIRLWRADAKGSFTEPGTLAARHDDVVQDLTFSPDGLLLASASYDRLVRLWDVKANKERHVLKDHSDSVYGVSFSPDGRLLATGGADRAVKVWDVSTGTRLYTLGESTDWVHTVAWSPDGKHLAAAGVDRSIRVWQVDAKGGKVLHSVFAHEGPVLRLVYARDGKTLASVGEDRRAKVWDTSKMVELRVLPPHNETPLSLGQRPGTGELAVGLFDGSLVLIDAMGKQRPLLPVKPQAPIVDRLTPQSLVRGVATEFTLTGKHLEGELLVDSLAPKILARTATTLRFTLEAPATLPPGPLRVRIRGVAGESKPIPLVLDRFPVTAEMEPNDSPRTGQAIRLPATLTGTIARAGDLDWFRFDLKTGEAIGVQAVAGGMGAKLSPVLQVVDPEGQVVAESTAGHLGHTASKAGVYALGIRDAEYRGGADMTYRLAVGPIPVVTGVFPPGLQRGTTAEVKIEGVHLGKSGPVRVTVAASVLPGTRVQVPFTTAEGTPAGLPSLVVGEFPDVRAGEVIPTPGTANGVIALPGQAQTWRFVAKKGQRLVLEVEASRIGSLLDSTLEILDAAGKPLPRAVLRSLSRTYTTFRDHDSRSPGIRIEAWNDLSMNDYLLVGSELLRIRALPKNPDDDCQFFAEQGQRLGYQGTTPTHLPTGTPMYRVGIHPPGTTFPANGLPMATLYWRNDDGGPGLGKDSRLVFDPPADGTYQVKIADSRGEGSAGHVYRLTVRPPRPDFTVSLSMADKVSKGSAVPARVTVRRIDEYDGPIDLKLTGLPQGFSAPDTNLSAGENETAFALAAEPTATMPGKSTPLELLARARIEGKVVLRRATATLPTPVEPGEIVTRTEEREVTLRPGGEARILVRIERRNGFTGRVPVEVQGLPYGVRVLDVGLNGILITPAETERAFVLYCEPWVQPVHHPIVVLAKREGKNTEHAAPSVLLKVAP